MSLPIPDFIRKLIYPILRRVVSKSMLLAPKGKIALNSVYDIPLIDIEGKSTSLLKYKGKRILIVNTASECGYTPQYDSLEKLSKKYADKIVVLGFPCNDFGAQEKGDENEIKNFCEKNYGVDFPMFKKVTIIGENKHPLYSWLCDPKQNGWCKYFPTWNFCKYLISEEGNLLGYFSASIDPLDPAITG